MGFEAQNDSYLNSLLRKMGITPNPDYKLSPAYHKAWAMTEAGRLLGKDVTQWKTLLNKEVARLEKNRQEFEKEQKRLREDPGHRALIVAEALIRDALTSKVTQ